MEIKLLKLKEVNLYMNIIILTILLVHDYVLTVERVNSVWLSDGCLESI